MYPEPLGMSQFLVISGGRAWFFSWQSPFRYVSTRNMPAAIIRKPHRGYHTRRASTRNPNERQSDGTNPVGTNAIL